MQEVLEAPKKELKSTVELPAGNSTEEDLEYWRLKLAHAETLHGFKGDEMKRTCLMMLDLYLDKYNEEKRMFGDLRNLL